MVFAVYKCNSDWTPQKSGDNPHVLPKKAPSHGHVNNMTRSAGRGRVYGCTDLTFSIYKPPSIAWSLIINRDNALQVRGETCCVLGHVSGAEKLPTRSLEPSFHMSISRYAHTNVSVTGAFPARRSMTSVERSRFAGLSLEDLHRILSYTSSNNLHTNTL